MNRENREHYEQLGVAVTCRSYREYTDMFDLEEAIFGKGPVLDVAGGASSFAAELRGLGIDAFAADPQYALGREQLEARARAEIEEATAKIAGLRHRFLWDYYGDVEHHRAGRLASLERFAKHYGSPEAEGVYVPAMLPELPYADDTFALVVCSHFLFLYEEQFDYTFHLAAVRELLRVCRPGGQVRVYPLQNLRWVPYPELDRMIGELSGFAEAELAQTRLPFIPGSEQVLVLTKRGGSDT